MKPGRPHAIALEFKPSPDGDNRLDVEIREGNTCVTYFSSSSAVGGARAIKVTFADCFAVRYFITEEHETICPGFSEIESDFAEIADSPWLFSLPAYVQHLRHYVFGLNHCFFECIARDFSIEPESFTSIPTSSSGPQSP